MALGINESVVSLISLLDLQAMNQFEVLFYPTDFSFKSVALATADSLITKLYIQDVTVPFGAISTERYGDDIFVNGFERVEEITMKFIENEFGVVRTWIDSWQQSVLEFNTRWGLILKENLRASLKNCIITPTMSNGLPSPATIQIEEMMYKSMGELAFSQGSVEAMTLDVTFSCKNTELNTIADLF